MGNEISSRFRDEINSRFQEEHVIKETLMDSKPAVMEQRLGERIVQVIQEQFSSLRIASKKPVVHGVESSNALTIGRSTNPPTRGNTLGNSNSIPRYARMDFPTYDGTNDPLILAHRCEQFFENQHTAEAEKVRVDGFHLLGEGQLCWEDFQKQYFQRFGPHESSNPVGELVTLRQTSTVVLFQRKFQEKLSRADELILEHLHVTIFMAGLGDSIKIDVALEQKQQLQKRQQSQTNLGSTTNLVKYATSLVDSFTLTNTQTSNQTPLLKRLTRAEMAEIRAKRLCYNYDEPY
ncbi:hypothetical protein R3W88_001120 [Solanum pinnatisectum]|uniref:Retrotransposon gag domain-containing protein n=1 Tax=Solanum pinnatisectum TaxID=50273 RepID=A0AAV9MHI0_9SOLN|nr:hypothetical protein R3W88_001120 [Solanum pinnatisectum]